MDIFNIILREKVKRVLKQLPTHVIVKLHEWINSVAKDGLSEVRKIPGYHDEPLKGQRKGQRSIRLSRSYRAIYEINKSDEIKIIEVIEVNKHDY